MPLEFDQWSTIKPLLPGTPAWIPSELDAKRVAAYAVYEQIYWTVPEAFRLVQRGSDSQPVYIPSARIIVEALHRYMAPKFDVIADPTFGDANQQALATQVMTDLKRREKLRSKFNSNKRYGIIRGDWVWVLYGNAQKEAGSRISILPADPGQFFPIYNEADELIGWHMAEEWLDKTRDKWFIRRTTWRKTTGIGGPSPITVEEALFETNAWGWPDEKTAKVVQVLRPPQPLPSPIDQLPIYVIPHFNEPEPTALWGSSEIRGFETLIAAVSQSASDEDISLALEGLGCYATNAGTPVDPDTGEDIGWDLGPGKVVEIPDGSMFERVTGVGSVDPFQSHIGYLESKLEEASGIGKAALGSIEVDVAQSGIALTMRLGPTLAKAEEKEDIVTDVWTTMLFDLSKWYVGYEGTAFNSLLEATRWIPLYGSKLPVNKDKEFDNVMRMVETSAIPLNVAWGMLRKLGYELPDDTVMQNDLINQTAAMAAIEADAMASRISGEIDSGAPTEEEAV